MTEAFVIVYLFSSACIALGVGPLAFDLCGAQRRQRPPVDFGDVLGSLSLAAFGAVLLAITTVVLGWPVHG